MFNTNYPKESQEYINNLWDKEIGKPGREYLQKRNISPRTTKIWKLGYSPEGFIPECYKNNKGEFKFWEKRNGRITIPVYDSNGKLVSISGRGINKDLKPKYIHYQFSTGKTLFGLYINEKSILKNNMIIFTEGQLDVISSWQNGLDICACTFGAHFSSEQLLLSSRYTDRVNILYDNDEAGEEGTYNSLEKAKVHGDIQIKILKGILKKGEDLDNWIQKNDYRFIIKIINNTKENLLKYKLNLINN